MLPSFDFLLPVSRVALSRFTTGTFGTEKRHHTIQLTISHIRRYQSCTFIHIQKRNHSFCTSTMPISTSTFTSTKNTIYYGTFIHSLSSSALDICHQGAIGVNENGKIEFVERDVKSLEEVLSRHPKWAATGRVVKAKDGGFFFPGFIDTHIHAPQYPNAGIFGTTTLLDWLKTYTFPTESSFKDLKSAKTVYQRVVNRTLSHGTTTASYYATIHVPATNLLSSLCLQKGQRAFVGRVCMDTNCEDYYQDTSVEQAIDDTKATIDHVKKIDPGYSLISPVITPRFAIACTSEMMTSLGELAKEEELPIQTHISENEKEIAFVSQLFPESKSYADVYDTHGLLTSRTILAHAVHTTPSELQLIKSRSAKISHCPVSNSSLGSGIARVRDMLNSGVDVGLGTDVSGGYSPSILEAGRQALLVSRLLAQKENDDSLKLNVEEALYLGTLGGAKVVGLEDKIGNFEVGKEWDAILVRLQSVSVEEEGQDGGKFDTVMEQGPVDLFPGQEKWEDKLAKWVYSGDDRCNIGVWVQGRLVHERKEGLIEKEIEERKALV